MMQNDVIDKPASPNIGVFSAHTARQTSLPVAVDVAVQIMHKRMSGKFVDKPWVQTYEV